MECTGEIKWFDEAKGYGFIKNDDGGKDVFVHIKEVEKSGFTTLIANTAVSFEIRKNPKNDNFYAANIKLLRG